MFRAIKIIFNMTREPVSLSAERQDGRMLHNLVKSYKYFLILYNGLDIAFS